MSGLTPETTGPDPIRALVVHEALSRAVAGDPHGGGMLLVPMLEEGRRSTWGLCCMLATAAMSLGEQQADGGMWVLEVENSATGESGTPEDMPPEVAFASRFAVAYANGDMDTAYAHFAALSADVDTDAGEIRVIDGVLALFLMATATARALVDEQRNNPTQDKD
ncbi:hypothetical protein [Streptomyces parvulus]|uniref:hypothetical protein n=1 Tax=Streptomyces parvulus TaxID=146923 RepID=UPI003826361F